MLRTRVIPCLQLMGGSLVKTVRFRDPAYIGDPVNTVRIFNELEVDELCFLDIRATLDRRPPDLALLQQLSDECFCPVSYGGGVTDFDTARRIFSAGFEKIIIGAAVQTLPGLIPELAAHYGSQAVVGAVDVRKNLFGKYRVYTGSGTRKTEADPVSWACRLEAAGAGELLLTAIDREGTWSGFDLELVGQVSRAVSIPVIAHGGAGSIGDIGQVVKTAGASAAAAGSMVVYQKQGMGVLVNFPDREALEAVLKC